MDQLLEADSLNDVFVDKQITQNTDFTAKTHAIREYNKLRSRVNKKIDVATKGENLKKQVYILGNGREIEF